jgi:hypothetical protein
MNYPQSYFQRLFSSARPLELSRIFGIYLGIIFVIILCLCGMIVWVHNSQGARPYFLYTNSAGDWVVYRESGKKVDVNVPWHKLMTESLITHFVQNYFMVSKDSDINENSLWCSSNKCDSNIDSCKIYCSSTPTIYTTFVTNVLDMWKDKAKNGETQQLDPETIRAEQINGLKEDEANFWKVTGILKSSKGPDKKIVCFVTVSSNNSITPQTFGLYISDFSFYEDVQSPENNKI